MSLWFLNDCGSFSRKFFSTENVSKRLLIDVSLKLTTVEFSSFQSMGAHKIPSKVFCVPLGFRMKPSYISENCLLSFQFFPDRSSY